MCLDGFDDRVIFIGIGKRDWDNRNDIQVERGAHPKPQHRAH
jgi:hypothetical protein